MIINFRVCKINRDVYKLTQTPTLIKKVIIKSLVVKLFGCVVIIIF